MRTHFLLGVTTLLFVTVGNGQAAGTRVEVAATPDGGIQPQTVVDAKGVLHLLYFKGLPGEGDLFYIRRELGQDRFSAPLRVNSQPGSAVAVGTIRGGQLALGKNGRVHVAWNGSGKAQPRLPMNNGSPMLYSRLDDAGAAFEPQRNLMLASGVLDGGGTVAADNDGNVYVAWQGLPAGSQRGEDNRRVLLARSTDDGKSFAREEVIFGKTTGACGCCGMKAFVDRKGSVYVLYRAAREVVHRDMYLLCSKDRGSTFEAKLLQEWEIGTCPMSSETFAEGPDGVVAAWETGGQVFVTRINPDTFEVAKLQRAPGSGAERKHPALAFNAQGDMLLAWTEGTGWQKGGALAWQVYDKSGNARGAVGRVNGAVPVWGLPSAAAGKDGSFQIFH